MQEVLAVYTHGDGDAERHVFVFPASKVGHDLHSSGRLSHRALESLLTKIVHAVCESDVARCESLKEALGFQLTLNDHGDTPGERLTDLDQIRRTSCVVNRWAENFKSTDEFSHKTSRLLPILRDFHEPTKQYEGKVFQHEGGTGEIKEDVSKRERRAERSAASSTSQSHASCKTPQGRGNFNSN